MRTRAVSLFASVVVLLAAPACGDGGDDYSPVFTDSTTTTVIGQPVETTAPRLEPTIPIVGDDGDTAEVQFSVRRPEHLSGTDMPMPDSCGEWTADFAGIDERALIVPVDVQVKVTSELAADVSLRFAGSGDVDKLVVFEFSDGSKKCRYESEASGGLLWDGIEPGERRSTVVWVVMPKALTPEDPEGAAALQHAVVHPQISIQDGGTSIAPDYVPAPGVLLCGGELGQLLMLQLSATAGCPA